MNLGNKREAAVLFLGDILILLLSLWLTLYIRNSAIPSRELFYIHLLPFSLLFLASLIIFYIAGLYEKHTVLLKSRLPSIILSTEVITSVIAIAFFYLIPYFGIAPKITLILYIVISFLLTVLWRLYLSDLVVTRRIMNAILIGAGKEIDELNREITKNQNYGIRFVEVIDLDESDATHIESRIRKIHEESTVSIIVIDLEHDKIKPILGALYSLIFSKIRFVAMYKVYEEVFERIPFSLLQYNWFLENISTSPKKIYDALKRFIDIVLSLIGMVIFILFIPFVFLARKIEGKGPVFIIQERIGQEWQKIRILKFGTMTTNDRGIWVEENDSRITSVGKFLRRSRIDEFPQFWNVLRGDLSLIGPRPDLYDLGIKLEKEIPYYAVRNVIQPGLSGWAQIKQDLPPQSLEETKVRLAYDLYYVKNRSFIIDLRIILKTVRTLLSRSGR